MFTYDIEYNDEYVILSMDKYRAITKSKPVRIILKSIAMVGLLGLLVIFIGIGFSGKPAVLVFSLLPILLLFLLHIGPKIDYWLIRKKLMASPFFNKNMTVVLSENGYSCNTDISKLELLWEAIDKLIFLEDGILVFIDGNNFSFLPKEQLKNGGLSEVKELINSKDVKVDSL